MVVLHERPPPVVPPPVVDLRVDTVPLGGPALDGARQASRGGQPDTPVERHPTHQPPVGERLPATPVSQMPSSGWSQFAATQSSTSAMAVQPRCGMSCPARLADRGVGEETGDQHRRVGEVHLPGPVLLVGRPHPEVAAPLVVEQSAEHARESNRGQQNQSTEPSVLTSAAVCRSPMVPWSAIAASFMTVLPMPSQARHGRRALPDRQRLDVPAGGHHPRGRSARGLRVLEPGGTTDGHQLTSWAPQRPRLWPVRWARAGNPSEVMHVDTAGRRDGSGGPALRRTNRTIAAAATT